MKGEKVEADEHSFRVTEISRFYQSGPAGGDYNFSVTKDFCTVKKTKQKDTEIPDIANVSITRLHITKAK